MLDMKLIRSDLETVRGALRRRGERAETALETLLELDRSRREILVEVEERRSLRNTVSEEIARIIMTGGNSMDIAAQSRREGVLDLRQSGLRKVRQGITSLEEVLASTNE